jgi:hypothetical protein
MRSQLQLEVYESGNVNTLTIIDRSIYNSDIEVSCEQLVITSPGFGDSVIVDVTNGFNTGFTSHDLGYTKKNCDKMIGLQDGIYTLTYQICPIDVLNVTYNHLRQTQALKKYYEALCSLELSDCSPTTEQKNKLNKLKEIKQYLDAAKSYVEYCNNPIKGLELHNYAIDKLNALDTLCKTC